jgi:carbon monoxide dehydrogenase subunit G
MQVVAFQPDSKYGFQMNAGPAKVDVVVSFKTVGTGTKLNLNAQGQPGGIFKLAEPVMASRVKAMMEENLARLKTVLEKG